MLDYMKNHTKRNSIEGISIINTFRKDSWEISEFYTNTQVKSQPSNPSLTKNKQNELLHSSNKYFHLFCF